MNRRQISPLLVALAIPLSLVLAAAPSASGSGSTERPSPSQSWTKADAMSSPPDTSKKVRKLHKTDLKPLGASALAVQPGAFLRDPIVSNTNTNLTNTDTAGDNEPSIAVNPSNPNEIVIASFTGSSGFYRSTDGGNTWTFANTYTQPPGQGAIPNDQQEEFTRGNLLAAVFLDGPNNIMTGTTANAGNQASWNWPLDGAGNVILTNTQGITNSDQPWLVTAPRPGNLSQDNIYSAYDDFTGAPDMQVNVANSADPPNFTNDVQVGTAPGCCGNNPGLRLATDRRTGFTYAVWQTTTGPNLDNSVNAQIHLNRTTDGGQTWTLNGNAGGIVVATGASNQRTPKFGTVNALIGGVHHAAVDPVTGDVYVVYACGDGVGSDNPLCTVRVHDDGSGTGAMAADAAQTVTTLNSALPSIAVASNGVLGVLFTSFDGFSSDGFPVYTAHLSMSDDHGATWSDQVLETSLSPVTDNGNNRQRVLGDYQELMAVGRTFYGTFTGNGAGFGRAVSNMDPIFFKTFAGGPAIAVTGDLDFGTVARGTSATRDITVQNVGTSALVVNGVTMGAGSDPAFSIVPTPGTPTTIQPSDSVTFQVKFSPPGGSSSATRTGTVVIESNDPDNPTVTLSATGQPGTPQVTLAADDLRFGDVPVDDRTAPHSSSIALRLSNQASCAQCDLRVTSLGISGANASDFSIVGAPSLPVTIGAANHLDLTVAFDPSSDGSRSATLRIDTDDPATPTLTAALSGNGLLSAIGGVPDPVIFGPTVTSPACGAICGLTSLVTVTNTGQAELIVDSIGFSNPAFSGPLATNPPARVASNASFAEPVLFAPTGAPDRSVDGVLSIAHLVSGSVLTVAKNIPLCGEAVGRGIRVLVVKKDGTVYPTISRLTLQSFGLQRKTSVDQRNLALTTIDPTTSCQRIRFHYENQNLPVAETIGKKSAYYTLKVTVGNLSATQTITLAANEFKTIVVTVG